MVINKERVKKLLKEFDFKKAFIEELGWNNHRQFENIEINTDNFKLEGIAQKCGMVAFTCSPSSDGKIPEYNLRKKIETRISKSVFEHLIIFIDGRKQNQKWQWAKREKGKPVAIREEHFQANQTGERLIQKIENIAFSLEEEESGALTIVDVAGRARGAFDVDRVTKKFYEYFKKEHEEFSKFINGITEKIEHEWYASLMLNRLMFVYFIQKKGFLDGDIDYLKNKLKLVQKKEGKNKFHSFYREFLLILFHKGLGAPEGERSGKLKVLIGRVPYLNGGLFDVHTLEKKYSDIEIPDSAFEKIFEFFDRYDWHLDDRPLKSDNEINPDVIGYIFEKYINQKQMGAYYTKEDITEYISKNTIIPFLFDCVKKECAIAFNPQSALWKLLQNDPNRYIYSAVKKGVNLPLPEEIAIGLDTSKPDLLKRRSNWNKSAPEEYALPTEIWREVVERRKRYEEVKRKIENGEITEINDFITYNLNIRQFAQDVIENCEGPESLRVFYYAIAGRKPQKSNEKYKRGISILDPTCGSGAFLFAALNILEPLYEACLDRMEKFIEENPGKFEDFKYILAETKKHPSPKYFIYKSIILNNLFGVDIMNEAVEIAKLRLFLKLVAQVEKMEDIEPLPDIDFNIRAGNSLVGFANYQEVKISVENELSGQTKLIFENPIKEIDEKAEMIARAFERFCEMQENHSMDSSQFHEAKTALQKNLSELNARLDEYLAGEYGINEINIASKKKLEEKFQDWKRTHQPFHWFVEFYDIIQNKGGFNVIIGNPPYVEYSKILKQYSLNRYETIKSGNVYAQVLERGKFLANNRTYAGWIVPISSVCTDRTESLQKFLKNNYTRFVVSFDVFPSKIFEGGAQRVAILILKKNNVLQKLFATKYYRWLQPERKILCDTIYFFKNENYDKIGWLARVNSEIQISILKKILKQKVIGRFVLSISSSQIYVHRIINNFIKAINFEPYFKKEDGVITHSDDFKLLHCDLEYKNSLICLLNSNLFYWFWRIHGDGFHCGFKDIEKFPCNIDELSNEILQELKGISKRLNNDFKENSEIRKREQKKTGRVELQTFFIGKSKPIIDEIDKVLAEHYGFTEEELDFIINYDIKYRMGKELEEKDN